MALFARYFKHTSTYNVRTLHDTKYGALSAYSVWTSPHTMRTPSIQCTYVWAHLHAIVRMYRLISMHCMGTLQIQCMYEAVI